MKILEQVRSVQQRLISLLLTLVCLLGLVPTTAFAAATSVPSTITMEDCTHNGVHYESPALDTCWLHQMRFDYSGNSIIGFCADHDKEMGWSLEGHKWDSPQPINDPTVKIMMAYYYAHSRGIFTDQAKALGVDQVWGSDYTWTMNAWVQAVIWRYKQGTLNDPAAVCAEELMYVYNNLQHTSYTSIDEVVDGMSLRERAQYILDLGEQGVWGECEAYQYTYAGPGSNSHPADRVQGIIIGDLDVTRELYELTVKKVDSTNPNKGLPGARFLVQNANGSYSREAVTGSDGTFTLRDLEASTYSILELTPPEGYEIDNAGPQYVVLPGDSGTTVTVTFTNTPIVTGEGSIRKVDADDPSKGLAGAVIKIEGVDNSFTGTYVTGSGGYLEDVPWDTMPIGSFVATELTPPSGYTLNADPDKNKQEFFWDGKNDVDLVFEDDAKVKLELLKLDDSENPLEGAVFNIFQDWQLIGTEATGPDGTITVPNITAGTFAFVEVSVPEPFAKLQDPVVVHVDQADVDGGRTISVTAVDQRLPNLTILKQDGQTKEVIPGTTFEIKGVHHGDLLGLRQNGVILENRVHKGLDVLGRSPAGAPILRAVAVFLGVFAFDVDCQPQARPTAQAHQQIGGVKTGGGGLKRGGKAVHQVQYLVRKLHPGRKPPCLPQLGGIEAHEQVREIGEDIFFQVDLSHRSSTFFRTFSTVFRAISLYCSSRSSTEVRVSRRSFRPMYS